MNLISKFKQHEDNSIVETLAMMTYIPSIGRVLERGGVDKFTKIMAKEAKQLEVINNQNEFDSFHDSVISVIINKIKTKKEDRLSYGQAQKPLNVFFKVYVDWARRPTLNKSVQLKKFLHVPLDSILMKEIKNYFPDKYEKHIVATYASIRDKLRKTSLFKEYGESGLHILVKPSDFNLNRIIFKDMYYAWQHCLRAIYPDKPILLDVLWYLKRKA